MVGGAYTKGRQLGTWENLMVGGAYTKGRQLRDNLSCGYSMLFMCASSDAYTRALAILYHKPIPDLNISPLKLVSTASLQ